MRKLPLVAAIAMSIVLIPAAFASKAAVAAGDPVVNGKVVVGPISSNNGIADNARGSKPEYGKVREDIKIDVAVKQIQVWIPPKK